MYIFGQPVLRKQTEEVPTDYPNLNELIDNMFETMKRAEGVGLAAPQIGLPLRMFVVDLDVISDDMPEYKGFLHAYINPEIIEVSGEQKGTEGCLSVPDEYGIVTRPEVVRVRAQDRKWFSHF